MKRLIKQASKKFLAFCLSMSDTSRSMEDIERLIEGGEERQKEREERRQRYAELGIEDDDLKNSEN